MKSSAAVFLFITYIIVDTAHGDLPVAKLSLKYRNWTYFNGNYDGYVVPPNAGDFSGQTLTDAPVIFEKTEEDKLPGQYRLGYLFYNGTAGGNGYETGLAISRDLLKWNFNQGGDNGIILKRNSVPGTYDYGGVTMGGFYFNENGLRAPRKLKKKNGKYYAMYGCYPSRAGYEQGNGGEGMAYSTDGVTWTRVSETVPTLPGGSNNLSLLPRKASIDYILIWKVAAISLNGSLRRSISLSSWKSTKPFMTSTMREVSTNMGWRRRNQESPT